MFTAELRICTEMPLYASLRLRDSRARITQHRSNHFWEPLWTSAPSDRTTNALYPAVANSPRLLFPDELYCPDVSVAVFGLNYALAAVAFCLAAAVSYKTKSLVSCNARKKCEYLDSKGVVLLFRFNFIGGVERGRRGSGRKRQKQNMEQWRDELKPSFGTLSHKRKFH